MLSKGKYGTLVLNLASVFNLELCVMVILRSLFHCQFFELLSIDQPCIFNINRDANTFIASITCTGRRRLCTAPSSRLEQLRLVHMEGVRERCKSNAMNQRNTPLFSAAFISVMDHRGLRASLSRSLSCSHTFARVLSLSDATRTCTHATTVLFLPSPPSPFPPQVLG